MKDGRKETQRQQLQAKVNSLRSDLDHADTLADEGDVEGAQEGLRDLESRLTSAKETAAQHGFDDLREEIGTLERECEERLMEVLEQLQAYPIPDRIPRAPDVSVDYDALTDEESIGAGGTSDVTKATLSTATGDVQLAIKRPRMAGTLHTDAVESLLEEAETWDKIDDHDHIVGVVDYGSQPVPWIAMEYMDAGHLGEHAGQMEMPQALWTALNVTDGIYYAHRRGIAHLDLKPENILFRTVEDSWDVPKVADWGLAKHLLEHSKSVEGMSINYAAPEQFDDEYGQTDDITDVYQLGAVLYKLFTGRPPFRGQPFKVVNMVKTDRPTPPSEIAEVPEGLDDILLTALAKEKDNRYDDIVYLRDDLQELFDNLKRSVR
ncbi:protein kinase domain-containing protein [Halorubrum ezzemoulense]|uniref:protein kinase domain-containing protein n=1 Tax=Halorubrum ezzemoulense TaxID=337243 RepID=UPI00232B2CDA|nr:serine/threonine-protein kinase [Halorubrum ezzemoulense]MDB2242711.1 serine/threonine-protein kinase [Halorubrum ezzemoulense]